MKNLAVIGRILFALPFLVMGLNHFFMTDLLVGMMSSFIPGGGFTILLTGLILIAASVSIMLNKFLKIACYSIAGLLFLFITTIHIPGLFTANWQLSLIELVKDMGLLGGSILIAAYFGSSEPETEEK
jgi:uncharacterized membrane protein